jgi:hypothetical protein
LARAAVPGAASSRSIRCYGGGEPMVSITRFGKKLRTPSTFQIKHQFLIWWLKHQTAKEAAEGNIEKAARSTNKLHVHEAF